MHDFAAYVGVENYLQPVIVDDIQRYAGEPRPPALYEFLMAARISILVHENGLHMPTTVEALDFLLH